MASPRIIWICRIYLGSFDFDTIFRMHNSSLWNRGLFFLFLSLGLFEFVRIIRLCRYFSCLRFFMGKCGFFSFFFSKKHWLSFSYLRLNLSFLPRIVWLGRHFSYLQFFMGKCDLFFLSLFQKNDFCLFVAFTSDHLNLSFLPRNRLSSSAVFISSIVLGKMWLFSFFSPLDRLNLFFTGKCGFWVSTRRSTSAAVISPFWEKSTAVQQFP